jgi:hypothetical protein
MREDMMNEEDKAFFQDDLWPVSLREKLKK